MVPDKRVGVDEVNLFLAEIIRNNRCVETIQLQQDLLNVS